MDLSCFIVQAFKTSESEGLFEEGIFHFSQKTFDIVRAMLFRIEAKCGL